MNPKIFRLPNSTRWTGLIMALLVLITIAVIFNNNRLFLSVDSLFIGVIIFVFLLLFFLSLSQWLYRIEFWENEVRAHVYMNPFAKQIRCAYEDILHIRAGNRPGTIQIASKNRKPFYLVNVDPKTMGMINELMSRIDSTKIQEDTVSRLQLANNISNEIITYSKYLIATQSVMMFFQFFPATMSLIRNSVGWEFAWRQEIFETRYIESFSMDSSGTPWVLFSDDFGKEHITARVDGEHLMEFPAFKEDSINIMGTKVFPGINGDPWVVTQENVFHFKDNQWEKVPAQGYSASTFSGSATDTSKYWFMGYIKDNQSKRALVEINAKTEQVTPIFLPDELGKNETLIDGVTSFDGESALVATQAKGGIARFYRYQDGKWLEQAQPIRVSQFQWYQLVFSTDKHGNIWTLSFDEESEKQFINRFNPEISSWEQSEVDSQFYGDMAIDSTGRVWMFGQYSYGDSSHLQHEYGVDVYQPHWGSPAKKLARYTDENSSYEPYSSAIIVRSDDRRVWTFAQSRLLWTDGSALEIPHPLPDWMGIFTNSRNAAELSLVGVVICLPFVIYFTLKIWLSRF